MLYVLWYVPWLPNALCVVVIFLSVIPMTPNALSGVVIIPYVIPMTPNVLYVVIFPSAHELVALRLSLILSLSLIFSSSLKVSPLPFFFSRPSIAISQLIAATLGWTAGSYSAKPSDLFHSPEQNWRFIISNTTHRMIQIQYTWAICTEQGQI